MEGHRFQKQQECRNLKGTWPFRTPLQVVWPNYHLGCTNASITNASSKSLDALHRPTHLSSEPAILWPRRRSNSEQCAAFTLVQLYIECTISATMPNYAGSSRKLYQNENYVCSNHNDIKNAFIPFRNKEINVCLATNSSPACCATPNLSTGRDPPPPPVLKRSTRLIVAPRDYLTSETGARKKCGGACCDLAAPAPPKCKKGCTGHRTKI